MDPDPVPSGSSPAPRSAAKRKRDRERVRVTRACDRCKRRKVKCNGTQPCDPCTQTGFQCTYDAVYSRGILPAIPKAASVSGAATHPQSFYSPVSPGLHHSSPSYPPSAGGGSRKGSENASSTANLTAADHSHVNGEAEEATNIMSLDAPHQVAPSSRVSPEPSQTDLQGHYIGPASGVSFLLRMQRQLHQTVSFTQTSSIFTFGDAPLPEYDPSFCLLMPKDEAQRLLEWYFDFAVPTHRFFHRPTAESWLEEFYSTKGMMRNQDDAPSRKAALFMMFAHAQVHMPQSHSAVGPDPDLSARYFLAADQQLSKEKGSIRLTSVQARLTQCFWLLSQSRVNHCWSLFGTTAHLALAIGLNRNRKVDVASGYTYIEIECRRRTFWCAYSLDNYLSAALGRPRTFHDPDIDTELPACIEDKDIFADRITSHAERGQSLMLAPVNHVKLSQIVSMILQDLYSIRPVTKSKRVALTAKCSNALKEWRTQISQFLDVKGISASLLRPIYQRQRNVLNLAYWHAMILTHRPVLLSNFAKLQQYEIASPDPSHRARDDSSVRECLKAAMSIVDTVDGLVQSDLMFRAYWFTLYFAFSAVVILYVYAIQQRHSTSETYKTYLDAAVRCQDHIANFAAKDSLSKRYSLVLEQLRIEAVRQIQGRGTPSFSSARATNGATAHVNSTDNSAAPITGSGGQHHHHINSSLNFPSVSITDDVGNMDGSPSSSMADITDWTHFDSMVVSGFSGLEGFMTEDFTTF
ncbi:fungal-specific transcription factor domain-containing protein [Xylariales sp. PMI_506]|nr:fungal-specific transcription factor domain-containing protein [Xylariales sp. PMI_506]